MGRVIVQGCLNIHLNMFGDVSTSRALRTVTYAFQNPSLDILMRLGVFVNSATCWRSARPLRALGGSFSGKVFQFSCIFSHCPYASGYDHNFSRHRLAFPCLALAPRGGRTRKKFFSWRKHTIQELHPLAIPTDKTSESAKNFSFFKKSVFWDVFPGFPREISDSEGYPPM